MRCGRCELIAGDPGVAREANVFECDLNASEKPMYLNSNRSDLAQPRVDCE